MTLEQYFEEHPKAAIAVSGGTDSAFLLYMAKMHGKEVSAWYFMTPFQHLKEGEDTRRLCRGLGIELHVVKANILNQQEIIKNDELRCYYCKKYMFTKLQEAVLKQPDSEGWEIMEGTNASDQPEDRPGYRALQELGILSPLRVCGLSKNEIRERSRELGLFTAQKPSNSCLAARIPRDMPITFPLLQRAEQCEEMLRGLGGENLRVRMLKVPEGYAARIQVPEEQLELVMRHRQEITAFFPMYVQGVLLDLIPREEVD